MAREISKKDLPVITEMLKRELGADGYKSIARMGGLTNHTYHVVLEDGSEYVVRIPGDGTEELIDRSNEMISTKLACDLDIDAAMLFFGKDGSKITKYIPNAVTMSAETLHEPRHIDQMAQIFRKLHTCGVDTNVPFEVFDMAAGYEKIIRDKQVGMFEDYLQMKKAVMEIKTHIDSVIDIRKVPCHNDALCENWVEGEDKMYLIDWEYAGMNDGMWDLADVSIEAGFTEKEDLLLLRAYLGAEPSLQEKQHFMANKIYVDYLWTLWAKARVPYDGQPMEDWAAERYARLKENVRAFQEI